MFRPESKVRLLGSYHRCRSMLGLEPGQQMCLQAHIEVHLQERLDRVWKLVLSSYLDCKH
jgi:hypothetical protein